MPRFEEYKAFPYYVSWGILVGVSLFIIGYGMVLHVLVKEGPRHWEFYSVPTTPAESEYSTAQPSRTVPPAVAMPESQRITPPLQINPLPPDVRFGPATGPGGPSSAAASQGATP